MATLSRGSVFAGLTPLRWVTLFQQLEAADGPVYYEKSVQLHLEAESANGAETRVKIQQSVDGVTWTDQWASVTHLQPGGRMMVTVAHTRPHVRCILYSAASGRVDGTWMKPEAQVLPHLLPGEHLTMACSTFCEQDCETGTETAS